MILFEIARNAYRIKEEIWDVCFAKKSMPLFEENAIVVQTIAKVARLFVSEFQAKYHLKWETSVLFAKKTMNLSLIHI